MLKLNLCSVVLHLYALFAVAFSHDMCECRYVFTEQPSNERLCNPYPNGKFVTRCAVEYSTAEGAPLSIEWRAIDSLNSVPQPVLNAVTTQENTITSVGSKFTLELPSDTPQDHENYRYFCRVKFSNGTTLKESQYFYLLSRLALGILPNVPDCNITDVLSTTFQECIDPLLRQPPVVTTPPPTTPPPTTTTPPPPPPPTTTVPEVPTTIPTTDPPTTTTKAPPPTTPPPPPPTTPRRPPTTPPKPKPPTTPPPTPPPPTTTTTSKPVVTTVGIAGLALSFEEQILLFSAIAAVIVLVVVVLLLVLCLCLWNRLCQQSKYCTCCSRY